MTLLRLAAVTAAAFITWTSAADQAHAQYGDQTPTRPSTFTPRGQMDHMDRRSVADQERVDRELEQRNAPRDRRGRQLSPEDVAQQAAAAATAAGLSCQVSESKFLGITNENDNLFEVACQGGAGYILSTATPPQTFDCVLLAAQADRLRAEGGEVAANSTCSLPGNQNTVAVIASFAREAGVPCEVDAGKAVGATAEGNIVYEVGCANADGYHIEKAAQGWKKTDCMQIMSTNMTCEFTTVEEQVAGFKALLPGTAIDDCDAQRLHVLGQNDTGRFVEVKCASGDGYVARIKENAIDQVYPCAISRPIGGGCTMSPVEGAPAPAAATATSEE